METLQDEGLGGRQVVAAGGTSSMAWGAGIVRFSGERGIVWARNASELA